MTKLYILQEIKRTTQANGGKPLRKRQFESQTGITRSEWFGVYWARWSDALREAGRAPNRILTPALETVRLRLIKSSSYTRDSAPAFHRKSAAPLH